MELAAKQQAGIHGIVQRIAVCSNIAAVTHRVSNCRVYNARRDQEMQES